MSPQQLGQTWSHQPHTIGWGNASFCQTCFITHMCAQMPPCSCTGPTLSFRKCVADAGRECLAVTVPGICDMSGHGQHVRCICGVSTVMLTLNLSEMCLVCHGKLYSRGI